MLSFTFGILCGNHANSSCYQVENILVVGHSRCGGIRALMSMRDEEEDSRLQVYLRF